MVADTEPHVPAGQLPYRDKAGDVSGPRCDDVRGAVNGQSVLRVVVLKSCTNDVTLAGQRLKEVWEHRPPTAARGKRMIVTSVPTASVSPCLQGGGGGFAQRQFRLGTISPPLKSPKLQVPYAQMTATKQQDMHQTGSPKLQHIATTWPQNCIFPFQFIHLRKTRLAQARS